MKVLPFSLFFCLINPSLSLSPYLLPCAFLLRFLSTVWSERSFNSGCCVALLFLQRLFQAYGLWAGAYLVENCRRIMDIMGVVLSRLDRVSSFKVFVGGGCLDIEMFCF